MKQAQVADEIGVDPSYISRIERGKQPAPQRVLDYYQERFDGASQLESLAAVARETEQRRQALRDPELIARQNAYPLPGDKTSYVSEWPPDGITVSLGETFKKNWTIENAGAVPWIGRRLRRMGPTVGHTTLISARFTAIPDTEPGEQVTLSVTLRAPHVQTATYAQWKMVDQDDLLYFPTSHSIGLAIHVLVSDLHPDTHNTREPGDDVG